MKIYLGHPANLYFGHPVNTYDTPLERDLIFAIYEKFLDSSIENPNQPHHAEGYKRWTEETGRGMSYFYEEVLPLCNGGVFLPFRDGKWGAGVIAEARWLAERDLPTWEINSLGSAIELDALNQEARTLSVDETRARIRTASGELLPY